MTDLMEAPTKIRLVYGFGVNDADYHTQPLDHDTGKQVICPVSKRWRNMLKRVYYPTDLARHPTYIDATICDEWRSFMAFRGWYLEQEAVLGDLSDLDLDKDILIAGNKHYSPETCVFVTHAVNLLLKGGAARGRWPPGVFQVTSSGRFFAQLKRAGKSCYLGTYDTAEEAARAYRTGKARYVREAARGLANTRPDVAAGLMRHADLILMEGGVA